MTQMETVRRDSRSYRQGLVLGLTMAEVFLLLVFALLIALEALWSAERQKRKALEDQQGRVSVESAADQRLLDDLKAVSRDGVTKAIEHLRNGRDLEPLTRAERDFVTEVRAQQAASPPEAISDQWRTLTRAAHNLESLPGSMSVAEAVNRVLPNEKDRSRLIPLIERGLAAEKKSEHDWPPIISLSEANGYYFKSGSAELTPEFRGSLMDSIPERIVAIIKQFDVDVIEVVGHTDEQPLGLHQSNLDRDLVSVLGSVAIKDTGASDAAIHGRIWRHEDPSGSRCSPPPLNAWASPGRRLL
jgi:flagellar motor protein MotB